jgi:hypothetical protein
MTLSACFCLIVFLAAGGFPHGSAAARGLLVRERRIRGASKFAGSGWRNLDESRLV